MYVIYEIDEDKYYTGGHNWSFYLRNAMTFRTVGEAKAVMSGLYRRHSGYNLMYKKIS